MEVTPGKWYAVTTDSSCTVTDANGKVLCTAEAGEQKYFLATTPSITLSDEGATVTKATFNCALAALGLLGGGSDKLPAGYLRAEFLEGTGTQYIDVPYSYDQQDAINLSISTEFKFKSNLSGWIVEGYKKEMRLGIYSGKQPVGLIKDLGFAGGVYSEGWNVIECMLLPAKSVKLIHNGVTTVERTNDIFELSSLSGFRLFANDSTDKANLYLPKKWWKAKLDNTVIFHLISAFDPAGTPCMYDLVTRKPFYNNGTGQFIVGMKDAAQLRTVLRKLPDLTGQDMGTLTLSIPAESNTPEMQELLDSTETQKNWELTIQERAAEVATYSLRRVRKVVWVRKVQAENGSYVDASGLRWQTEWCSAIYSPRGNDPTLHDYEPFDSVQQAVEAWGLVPYEYPEDEQLLTETE